MKILVTGAAGFIGFHTVMRLLEGGHTVVGIDSINDYYDPSLKYDRLKQSGIYSPDEFGRAVNSSKFHNYRFIRMHLEDRESVLALMRDEKFEKVCSLAAQAGVRYSIENPYAYIDSNLTGFLNILEGCRHNSVEHLVFASSSSVYGLNEAQPFSTSHSTDHPISLYAATKKANEMMAHTYSHLYGLNTTGLRFFTVYGPWGRPDMAMYKFAELMRNGEMIDVYNHGDMERDFTYIDDIVEGVCRVIQNNPVKAAGWDPLNPKPAVSSAPYRVYNIGNNKPEKLMKMIELLEKELGMTARKNMMPLQPGDVLSTYADIDDLINDYSYNPATPLEEGIRRFAEWYRGYKKL
jgi:UDP-glucuronate 4-epimerase